MALVSYRKYEVKPEHVEQGRGTEYLQVNVPVNFLRDHCKAGDVLTLFIDSDSKALIIATPEQAASIEKRLIGANGSGQHPLGGEVHP